MLKFIFPLSGALVVGLIVTVLFKYGLTDWEYYALFGIYLGGRLQMHAELAYEKKHKS